MNNAAVGTKEKTKIFETILRSPGMSEKCKVVLNISRQNVLLLGRVIESGLLAGKNNFEDEIIGILPKESVDEFREIHGEILKKAELSDFYEKLKSI
ncbi:MAG: hypothetical protein WDO16_10985 [Bacteroidota bacterium]